MKVTVDDVVNFPFSSRTQDEKLRIVTQGKPRPFLNMAAAVTMNNHETDSSAAMRTHQFDLAMYDEVQWLTGCDIRHAFYCWPCLLFLPAKGLWNTTGVSDLVTFLEGRSKHEETSEHVQATLKLLNMLEQNAKISNIDVSEHNETVKRNRAILKRMIDVVCNLLTKEQPSYERINGCELDPESCVENLKFLSTYDVLNCNFIEDAVDLLQKSPNIVNDLVDTITKVLKMTMRKEIQQSTYVSIILGDHSKTSEKSQISTILRYLKGGKVCEKFIGFYNMGGQKSVSTIHAHISRVLTEFAFSERFLGYSLDGGILQTTDLIEFTIMMKNLHPFAVFVPWYGHGVDHVLQQSLANVDECIAFFKTLDEVKLFFQKKSKRFKAFEAFMAGIVPSTKNCKWFIRSQFIQVVNMYRKYFVQFFDSILQSSTIWESDDISKALGFLNILDDLHTVFLLQMFTMLFEQTTNLNKILKSSSPERVFSGREVSALTTSLVEKRDKGFEELWSQVQCSKCKERAEPVPKRIKLDLDDPIVAKYIELYQSLINRVIQEINVRFSNLSCLSFCQLLICDKHGRFLFSNDLVQSLMAAHGAHFDEEQVKNESIVLRTNGTVFSKKSIYDVLDFFIQAKLKDTFKYLYKLSEFILTLPVKSPTEEVSTTKFKEVRDWSYLPQATGQQSGDVSIPCIELEFLQELKKTSSFYEEIAVVFYELNKTFELLHR